MKKLLMAIMVLVLLVGSFACDGGTKTEDTGDTNGAAAADDNADNGEGEGEGE